MFSDTFNCPKCNYSGSVSELKCFNCDHEIIIKKTRDRSSISCSVCGWDQTPSCPKKCGASINFNMINQALITPAGVVMALICIVLLYSCS